mgnify:CR=1 FL=1
MDVAAVAAAHRRGPARKAGSSCGDSKQQRQRQQRQRQQQRWQQQQHKQDQQRQGRRRTALLVLDGVLPQQHVLGLRVLRHKHDTVQASQVDRLHLWQQERSKQAVASAQLMVARQEVRTAAAQRRLHKPGRGRLSAAAVPHAAAATAAAARRQPARLEACSWRRPSHRPSFHPTWRPLK